MSLIYGVDSTAFSNTPLTNGYTLYDWVMRKSCFPSFWGRSLTGENPITKSEIEFLKSKNCKIALIIRNLTEVSVSCNNGEEDALNAIKAAEAISVPKNKNIVLFAEILPDWSINHNWMISFANTLVNNGYLPGFIGNTDSSKNFNFGRQCSHYVLATGKFNQFNAVYWSTEPKYDFDPEIWSTYSPSELLPEDIHLWQYGKIEFHNIYANKNYAHDSSILDNLF